MLWENYYQIAHFNPELKNNIDSASVQSNLQTKTIGITIYQNNYNNQSEIKKDVENTNSVVHIATMVSHSYTSEFVTNTASESFIANNTLTISSDLSDSNGAFYVDENSFPGDPGVIPVGDALLPMFILLTMFTFFKAFREYKTSSN